MLLPAAEVATNDAGVAPPGLSGSPLTCVGQRVGYEFGAAVIGRQKFENCL